MKTYHTNRDFLETLESQKIKMQNKIIICDKEYKNITIVDTNNNVVSVICGNGDVITSNNYKVKFNVGD